MYLDRVQLKTLTAAFENNGTTKLELCGLVFTIYAFRQDLMNIHFKGVVGHSGIVNLGVAKRDHVQEALVNF